MENPFPPVLRCAYLKQAYTQTTKTESA